MGPDPDEVYPNEKIKSVVFIKNVISRPNIIAGEYSYYDDNTGAEKFEEHVTHHYEFIGDKLIIGKFCAIAKGIEFVMNGANHRMNSVTTYPFNIMGGGWEKFTPSLRDLPLKGDTVVGNDVWIGQNVTVMPGIHIGDGAVIAALTGHGAAITETARLTERRIVAADDVLSENDSALNDLRQRISQHPVVTVSFFVPDEHKDGGSTVTETGSLKSIDEQTGSLVFENGLRISARDIVSLKEENQGNYAGNCP